MLVTAVRAVVVILLGFLFAYLYGFIEHGFIPPAEHLRPRFFNHFELPHHNVRPVLSRPSSGPRLPTESGGGVSQFWSVDLRTTRRRHILVPFRRNLAETTRLDLLRRRPPYRRPLGTQVVSRKFDPRNHVLHPRYGSRAFQIAPSFSPLRLQKTIT